MFLDLIFYIHVFNLAYAISGLVVLIASVILLFDYAYNDQILYRRYIEAWVWHILMAASIGGVLTTLLYSEVLGFIPCSLCWLQRVALYPQALLSVLAFLYRDTLHFPLYGIGLSVFGFAVAVYQYVYQAVPKAVLDSGVLPCLADGSADCGNKIMEVFGFVTFPFLSAVLFLFLFTLYLHLYARERRQVVH